MKYIKFRHDNRITNNCNCGKRGVYWLNYKEDEKPIKTFIKCNECKMLIQETINKLNQLNY